jgi:hypothetical protein
MPPSYSNAVAAALNEAQQYEAQARAKPPQSMMNNPMMFNRSISYQQSR